MHFELKRCYSMLISPAKDSRTCFFFSLILLCSSKPEVLKWLCPTLLLSFLLVSIFQCTYVFEVEWWPQSPDNKVYIKHVEKRYDSYTNLYYTWIQRTKAEMFSNEFGDRARVDDQGNKVIFSLVLSSFFSSVHFRQKWIKFNLNLKFF